MDGIKEINCFKKGEISLYTHTLTEPSAAKTILKRLILSQSAFAGLIGSKARGLNKIIIAIRFHRRDKACLVYKTP